MDHKDFSKTKSNRKQISDEVIKNVERLDITQVAQSIGLELMQVGKHLRSGKNNALEFYTDTNKYTNHATGIKGGNTINLVQYECGLSFPNAVEYLQNLNCDQLNHTFVKRKKEPYVWNRERANNTDRLMEFSTNQRQFPPALMQLLVDKNYIMQDRSNNIVYKWFKNGSVVGADIQGTTFRPNAERPYFKGIDKNSEDFGFNLVIGKRVDKIYTFESPNDGIAYLSLKQKLNNCMIVSTSGTSNFQRVEKFMNYAHINYGYNYGENSVHICSDNDEAGSKFWKVFEEKNKIISQHSEAKQSIFVNDQPPQNYGKDWNDVLINYTKFLKQQEKSKSDIPVTERKM